MKKEIIKFENKYLSTLVFKMYKKVTPIFERDFQKFCLKYNLVCQIVVKKGWFKDMICLSIIGDEESTSRAIHYGILFENKK